MPNPNTRKIKLQQGCQSISRYSNLLLALTLTTTAGCSSSGVLPHTLDQASKNYDECDESLLRPFESIQKVYSSSFPIAVLRRYFNSLVTNVSGNVISGCAQIPSYERHVYSDADRSLVVRKIFVEGGAVCRRFDIKLMAWRHEDGIMLMRGYLKQCKKARCLWIENPDCTWVIVGSSSEDVINRLDMIEASQEKINNITRVYLFTE